MTFVANRGDSGQTRLFNVTDATGVYIPASELAAASFVLIAYRYDQLRQALAPIGSDDTIKPQNTNRFNLYENGDTIRIGDEEMLISAVPDQVNYQIDVTRAVLALNHRKGARIRHTLFESPTAVTWAGPYSQLQFEIEPGFTDHVGTFELELQVTTGSKDYVVTTSSPTTPLRLQVLEAGA